MLNINVIDELEDMGIGCDIDRLEALAVEAYYCEILGVSLSDKQKEVMSVLREVKPNSKVFLSDINTSSNIIEKYNKLENVNRLDRCNKINDEFDSVMETLKNGGCMTVIGVRRGVPIRIEYRRGELVAAFTVNWCFSITRSIIDKVPRQIDGWVNIQNVEVRAVMIGEDMLDSVVSGAGNVDVECYDIVNDVEGIPEMSIWNKLSYMSKLGFRCSEYFKIEINDKDSVEDAILAVIEKYRSGDTERAFVEAQSKEKKHEFVIDITESKREAFVTTVTGIEFENNGDYVIPIVTVRRIIDSSGEVISKIKLKNIKELYEAECFVGNKVRVVISEDIRVLNINDRIQ